MHAFRTGTTALASAAMGLVLAGCATTAPSGAGTEFSLGRNANGDPCSASQSWNDPALGDRQVKYADAYSVNCRGTTAASLARVRVFGSDQSRADFTRGLQCNAGGANPVTLEGFSGATVQRCLDPGLGYSAVVINADAAGRPFQISAAPNAIGAAYQAARILAGFDAPQDATSDRAPIALSSIPQLTGDTTVAAASEELEAILSRGISLNFRGLYADASRYLTGALTSLPTSAPGEIRAVLLLEAGLADSNIQFFGSAKKNLNAAEEVIKRLSTNEQRQLLPKLQIYRGLDALNQRKFVDAQRVFTSFARDQANVGGSLNDPNTLVRLNTRSNLGSSADDEKNGKPARDVRTSISLADPDVRRAAFLETLAYWGLSFSELALGNTDAAEQAIEISKQRMDNLRFSLKADRASQDGLFWLSARLDRQLGRIQADKGQFAAAIQSFDNAIRLLTQGAIARSGTGSEPAIAELKLERASMIARAGFGPQQVDEAYDDAVTALLQAREENTAISTALLQPYLDRLADKMGSGDKVAAARYFEALQVASESGAARQVSQLQDIVSSGSEIGGKFRDLEDLQRQINELDITIAEAREAAQPTAEIEARRARVQDQYFALDAELQADRRLSGVSNKAAELGELQAVLQPGEAYARFVIMGDRAYGVLVEKDKAHAIRPKEALDDILELSSSLRYSIDGEMDERRLRRFRVSSAVSLYQSLFSEVDSILREKEELIVDGGTILSGLPAAVLVSNKADGPRLAQRKDPLDYTDVEFLATWLPTTVAMSPRSFIASRGLTPSDAPRELLGFAAPQQIADAGVVNASVKVGPCTLTPAQLTDLSQRLAPIPALEIEIAGIALGLEGDTPLIAGDEFTDTSVLARGMQGGDLSQYKILHFATHGLTEGQFGCAEAPAALVTSFGQDATSDMLLSFDEIADLKLNANLVVLSACETASTIGERALRLSGEAQPGSTLEGLVRSFFTANARSVMATFWATSNSGESELFMAEFYRAGRTNDIANSLNKAQRGLLADRATSHPFFWGGYFVVGNTDNRMLDGGSAQPATAP